MDRVSQSLFLLGRQRKPGRHEFVTVDRAYATRRAGELALVDGRDGGNYLLEVAIGANAWSAKYRESLRPHVLTTTTLTGARLRHVAGLPSGFPVRRGYWLISEPVRRAVSRAMVALTPKAKSPKVTTPPAPAMELGRRLVRV